MMRSLLFAGALMALAGCDLLNQIADGDAGAEAGAPDAASDADVGGPPPAGGRLTLTETRFGWTTGQAEGEVSRTRASGGLPMRFEGTRYTVQGRLRP